MNRAEKKNMRDKLLRARKNEFQKPRRRKMKKHWNGISVDKNYHREIRDKGLIELLTGSINKLEAELFT